MEHPMSANPSRPRPTIDVDALDLSGLHATTIALVKSLRELRDLFPGLSAQEGQELLRRSRSDLADLMAQLTRLGLPLELFTGDLTGEAHARVAVERIILNVNTLRITGALDGSIPPPLSGYLRELETAVDMLPEGAPAIVQHVTLDQVAALVNKSKRTLERYKRRKNDPLPDPDIPGGGGHADEWEYPAIRPWLERTFHRKLPAQIPRLRPPHH
jgi:hypothetical protein